MNMPAEWQEVTLDTLATEITVGFVGSMTSEYVPQGIPFLRSTNIEPYRINNKDLMYISEGFHKRIKKSSLAPGDVVIVRTGKPGTAAVIPDNFPVANCSDLVIVRPGPELNSRFLAYYINSAAQHHVSAYTVGAVQQHYNVGSAKSLKLLRPPLKEQEAIVKVLGALDDKIELNRRMNRTLEAIAQALFRSWFVDFEPVSAKREGRRPVGMDDATAALFPEHFQETNMGPIPAGWRVAPIGDLVKVVGGSTPRTGEPSFWEGGEIAWATPKDLAHLTDPVLMKTERQITAAGLSQISSGLLPSGTVLLSSRAPVGYVAIADMPVAVNQGFIALVCNKDLPNHYVVRWLQENMDLIESRANGTTFLEISKANFRPIPAILPSKPVLDRFSGITGNLHTRVVSNVRQIQQLTSLRDSLLPQLLSGELRVGQAEEMIQ